MTDETRQNLKTLIVGTLGFMLFWCTLAILSTLGGCGGSITPVQPPSLEKARVRGSVEIDIKWYNMSIEIDCAANAQRGDEMVDGSEAECCIAVGFWIDCWDVSSGRLVVQ